MQKWEYLFVDGDSHNHVWYPRWENEVEIVNWKKGPNLPQYANRKGKEGWEIISAPYVRGAGYTTTPRLIFKRPIEE